MVLLGDSTLDVFPLSLGGNVFGWTADRDESFRILDAYVAGGGNFIDTADSYSAWVSGNSGGESERIIGQWLADRRPEGVVVATKVSQHPEFRGLSAANVRAAAEASLQRLGVETIDLYYAHFDDETVPLEETVAAFGQLVTDGLVRATAVSNYSAERVQSWIDIARAAGSAVPVAVQPHYNLVERAVESTVLPVAAAEGLAVVPYFSLAKGFLAGKYRSRAAGTAEGASVRGRVAAEYATAEGLALLDVLDEVAAGHGVSVAAISLAWLRAQPTVVAPLASASHEGQVADLLTSAQVDLTADDLQALERASAPVLASR